MIVILQLPDTASPTVVGGTVLVSVMYLAFIIILTPI
jgi:hypothetical protein